MTDVSNERAGFRSRRVADAVLPALLPLLVARPALVTIAGSAASLLGLPASFGLLLVYGMVAVALAFALPAILRRTNRRTGFVAGFLLCAFTLGAILGRATDQFYQQIGLGLMAGLCWMAVAFTIRDYQACRRYLYAAAPITLVAVIIELGRATSTTNQNGSYSQYIAYTTLPAVLIFVDAAFDRRRVLNVVLAASSGLLMLSAGARGPLVVASLFIIARVVLNFRVSRRTALVAAGIGAAAMLLLVRVSADALGAMRPILSKMGLSTRVVERLLDGTLLEDRVRSALMDHTLDVITQHPLTGVGMANERPILAERMGAAADTDALGWYPHNVFLELWAQFGVIVGTLLIVLLLGRLLRVLVVSGDPDRRALVLIFVGLGWLPLLFSASYLSWLPFFGLLGLCLSPNVAAQTSAPGRAG